MTTAPPRPGIVINSSSTVTPIPARTGPVVSTITYLTRSGTSVGIAFNTFTLRPAPNSFTVFPTWSISTSPPSATSSPVTVQPNRRAIVGGAIGACALLIAAVTVFICIRRGRLSRQRNAHLRGKWYDLEGKINRDVVSEGSSPNDNAKVPVPMLTGDLMARAFHPKDKMPPHGALFKSSFVRDKHSTTTPPDPFADPQTPSTWMGHILINSPPACDVALEMDMIPKQKTNSGPL